MSATDTIGGFIERLVERRRARRHPPRYSVPDDVIRRTGIRFTPTELAAIADDIDRGVTPPPLSYNEARVLWNVMRERAWREIEVVAERTAAEMAEALALPEGTEIVPADRPRS